MKRVIITKPQCIELEDVNVDISNQDSQVIIKVLYVTLCGSDYLLYKGSYGGINNYPIVIGHEWSGSVISASKSSQFSTGDIVTGDCSIWCGHCDTCLTHKNLCRNIQKFGITCHGACQEIISFDEKYLYKAPPSLPPHLVALSEIFAVAYHAIINIDTTTCKSIAIIGAGTLGIAIYSLLRCHKDYVNKLTLYDNDSNKVSFIKTLSFIHPDDIQLLPDTPVIKGYSTSVGFYDCVIECSGSSQGLNLALNQLKPAGRLLALGMYKDHHLDTATLVMKGLRIFGIVGGTGYFQPAMDFLVNHQNIGNDMITNIVPFTEASKLLNEKRSYLKEQLNFN